MSFGAYTPPQSRERDPRDGIGSQFAANHDIQSLKKTLDSPRSSAAHGPSRIESQLR